MKKYFKVMLLLAGLFLAVQVTEAQVNRKAQMQTNAKAIANSKKEQIKKYSVKELPKALIEKRKELKFKIAVTKPAIDMGKAREVLESRPWIYGHGSGVLTEEDKAEQEARKEAQEANQKAQEEAEKAAAEKKKKEEFLARWHFKNGEHQYARRKYWAKKEADAQIKKNSSESYKVPTIADWKNLFGKDYYIGWGKYKEDWGCWIGLTEQEVSHVMKNGPTAGIMTLFIPCRGFQQEDYPGTWPHTFADPKDIEDENKYGLWDGYYWTCETSTPSTNYQTDRTIVLIEYNSTHKKVELYIGNHHKGYKQPMIVIKNAK